MKKGSKAGWERIIDREKRKVRELTDLKDTLGCKDKQKLERACEGGVWLTVLPGSQNSIYMSMEEFGEALQWRLDIPLQDLPLVCDGYCGLFTVDQ